MKTKKDIVVILGASGFPYKISAANEKNRLIGKSLILAGYEVHIITKIGSITSKLKPLPEKGCEDGIFFHFMGGSVFKSSNFLRQQITILKGVINELSFLWKIRHNNVTLILSLTWFHFIVYYLLLSIVLKIRLVMSIMEWHLVQINRSHLQRINDYLFDNIATKFFNKAIPISHYINNKIKLRNPKIKTYLLPVLTDINLFKNITFKNEEKYFLYCGHAGYAEVIEFIIKSFKKVIYKNELINLRLIINGSASQLDNINKFISSHDLNRRITILTMIPYKELISNYGNALALLIPLRETEQDKARFPQKIAEYTASKRPIITNNWGEISYFFKDNVNAFVCDKYDIKEYANKMNYVLNHPENSDLIGKKGYETSVNEFHFSIHTNNLRILLQ